MKRFKKLAFGAFGVVSLVAPLGFATVAHAQEVAPSLPCNGDVSANEISCDLSVDKQVSVNGGAFVEADTSADAAQATVGDTVTWKITVANNSTEGLTPHSYVYVADALPGGVTFNSYTATAGTYGVWGPNYWSLPLTTGGELPVSNLPQTLLLSSTANSTGLFKNTATLSRFDPCQNEGGCTYFDADPDNDSNDAWINVSAKPVVLADTTTLTNTGSGTSESLVAAGLIVATLAVGASSRLARNRTYSIKK